MSAFPGFDQAANFGAASQYGAPAYGAPSVYGAAPAYGTYGAAPVTAAATVNYENVVMRVPTHRRQRNIYVPGPVITRTLQAPPQVVVRKVQVQGPAHVERVQVQGPPREVVRKIAVPGPAREVVRTVQVPLPAQRVVKKVRVQGEPREVIKRVEVRGPPTEVVRKVLVAGPPTYEDVPTDVQVQGPPRDVEREVPVVQPVFRQVVREVPRPQLQPVPMAVAGPAEDHFFMMLDTEVEQENERLKAMIDVLKKMPVRQAVQAPIIQAPIQNQFYGTYAAPIGEPRFFPVAQQPFGYATHQAAPVQQQYFQQAVPQQYYGGAQGFYGGAQQFAGYPSI